MSWVTFLTLFEIFERVRRTSGPEACQIINHQLAVSKALPFWGLHPLGIPFFHLSSTFLVWLGVFPITVKAPHFSTPFPIHSGSHHLSYLHVIHLTAGVQITIAARRFSSYFRAPSSLYFCTQGVPKWPADPCQSP